MKKLKLLTSGALFALLVLLALSSSAVAQEAGHPGDRRHHASTWRSFSAVKVSVSSNFANPMTELSSSILMFGYATWNRTRATFYNGQWTQSSTTIARAQPG